MPNFRAYPLLQAVSDKKRKQGEAIRGNARGGIAVAHEKGSSKSCSMSHATMTPINTQLANYWRPPPPVSVVTPIPKVPESSKLPCIIPKKLLGQCDGGIFRSQEHQVNEGQSSAHLGLVRSSQKPIAAAQSSPKVLGRAWSAGSRSHT